MERYFYCCNIELRYLSRENKMTNSEQELFLTWQAEVDSVGPFAEIEQLQGLLERAPAFSENTNMYQWLSGFICGRRCEKQEKEMAMITD